MLKTLTFTTLLQSKKKFNKYKYLSFLESHKFCEKVCVT